MTGRALVLGASGFLGSHVTRQLVAASRDVRILVRASSDTRATDNLDIERVHGDVLDPASLASAMQDCESVFYCVVDTRAWLRDPAPLYQVNVDGLKNAMEAALAAGIGRFVFTSTFGTIGTNPSGISTEKDEFNWWDEAPHYIRCRVEAERLFMSYCEDRGLPGVAMCVGNTYGPDDIAPTPHGQMVRDSARGNMPFYWEAGGPCVGIEDAANAMLLAEAKGRVGERYAIAERWLDFKDMFELAATAGGVKPPSLKIPLPVLYLMAGITSLVCRVRGIDSKMSVGSIKCSRMLPNVSAAKARRELGWEPRTMQEVIPEAVASYAKWATDTRQAG